jgi:hypothetical protein
VLIDYNFLPLINWIRFDHAKHKYVRHPGVEVMGEMGGKCCCNGRNAVTYRWFSVYDQCLKPVLLKRMLEGIW